MRQIPLANHPWYALVDDSDYERLALFSWCIHPGGYAFRSAVCDGKRVTVYMHREVLLVQGRVITDHINHRRLDNRRSNLRITDDTGNARNSSKPRTVRGRVCSSPFKGVFWDGHNGQWKSQIQIAGRRHHLGYFSTDAEGARAYDAAAREHFGEFAVLNFPSEDAA